MAYASMIFYNFNQTFYKQITKEANNTLNVEMMKTVTSKIS